MLMTFFLAILLSNSSFKDEDFQRSLDWVLELSKHYKILDEHPELERVNSIGYSLVSNIEDKNLYSFQIVDIKEANAFALPGGFIFITRGMLEMGLSDDALASLLAHEIIHVKNRHSNKMEKRQTLLSALSNILLLGVLFGVKDDAPAQNLPPWWSVPDSQWDKYGTYETKKGNLVEGTYVFSVIFQELLMQGYSREFEMESDREGTYLMAQAGFSPLGTIELLEKLKNHYWEAPDMGYWRSHPYLEDRLELASVRVSSLKGLSQKTDPLEFQKRVQEKFYFLSLQERDEEKKKILFKIALNSCSRGILSFELNLKNLNEIEKNRLSRNVYERNYESLIKDYKRVINKFEGDREVQNNLIKLKERYEGILKEKEECFIPFKNYFYESFPSSAYLDAYYENYRDREEDFLPFIFYGSNLLRLGDEEKAVEIFKEFYQKGREEFKEKILEEIFSYGVNFKNLNALYIVQSSFEEDFVKVNFYGMFFERLKEVQSLKDLRKFLDRFPDSPFYGRVYEKLEELANRDYVKGRAFKSVGDFQSALEIYNKILENAYDTKIAAKIREELKEGGKL
ncbi:MAG: M48 family metallopeptidase [Thermoanaerobaculia bacterium]